MSDRGILDEAFIGMAFGEVIDKRDIADQNHFNNFKDEELPVYEKSIFVTAVKIYENKGILTDEDLQKATEVKTYGDLRNLVDEFNPKRIAYYKNM